MEFEALNAILPLGAPSLIADNDIALKLLLPKAISEDSR